MAFHKVRYIVNPASVCPAELLSPLNEPDTECEVDTDLIAMCAMGEILQTGPTAAPMSLLFDELLVSGQQNLIWKGAGPGRGIEMRRAFSGLFGRFFARAYLQRYHGFTWFAPIDGTPTYMSKRVRVSRMLGKTTELPDWICAGAGKIAVAEAKGSHQAANPTAGRMPGPIKTAAGQIQGVVVEKLQNIAGNDRWMPRSVKGWAVMSRWGAEDPMRDAFQYVLDPETLGEPLLDGDLRETIQDVARMHVGQTLDGMGYSDLAAEFADARFVAAARPRETVAIEVNGESTSTYLGAVVGPSGVMPVSLAEARTVASSLPHAMAQQVKFVGLDIGVIRRLRDRAEIEPQRFRRVADEIQIGPDSLLFAPLDRVVPRATTI
jgi:hypothetical protein